MCPRFNFIIVGELEKGGGYPPPARPHGWGVTPLQEKREGGGRGITPLPPLSAKRHFSCITKTCVSRGIAVVRCGRWRIFWDVRVPARPGPEGEGGAPLRARHMGGGVIPSMKKEKGGSGDHPPPPPARVARQWLPYQNHQVLRPRAHKDKIPRTNKIPPTIPGLKNSPSENGILMRIIPPPYIITRKPIMMKRVASPPTTILVIFTIFSWIQV